MNDNSSMDADNIGNVNVGYDKLRQPTAIHLNGKKIDPITTPRTTPVESMEALEHQLSYTTLGSTSNTRRRRFHGAPNAKKAINTKMKNMCSPYHKEYYVKSINKQNDKWAEKSVRFSGNAEDDEGIGVKRCASESDVHRLIALSDPSKDNAAFRRRRRNAMGIGDYVPDIKIVYFNVNK
ncbi:hypothetical protein ROZALSC1DRAFT_31218, partial [Rozella allomycis CSF55]